LYPRVQTGYLTAQVRQTPKVGRKIVGCSTKTRALIGKPISINTLLHKRNLEEFDKDQANSRVDWTSNV